MDQETVASDLSKIAASPDFENSAFAAAEAWKVAGVGSEAVEPILRFMEKHPDIDYGSPGPLTHFIESVCGPDYPELLLASVTRIPTSITLWMLNRVINGARSSRERHPLIVCMRLSRRKIQNDPILSRQVGGFLERIAREYPGE